MARRVTAALLLLSLLLPAVLALVAGLSHASYHLSERLAIVRAESQMRQLQQWERGWVGYSHAHGPGEEIHTHSIAVDLALQSLQRGETDTSEEAAGSFDHRLDKHLPPPALVQADLFVVVDLPSRVSRLPAAPHRSPPDPPPWT